MCSSSILAVLEYFQENVAEDHWNRCRSVFGKVSILDEKIPIFYQMALANDRLTKLYKFSFWFFVRYKNNAFNRTIFKSDKLLFCTNVLLF